MVPVKSLIKELILEDGKGFKNDYMLNLINYIVYL